MNTETEQQSEYHSLSEILKSERERRNMSPADVARYLCLNVDIIEKIEQQCDEKMLQDVFYRGYIRSYAKCVGVSEETLQDYLGAVRPSVTASVAQGGMSDMSQINKPRMNKKGLWLGITGLAVTAAVAAIWWGVSANLASDDNSNDDYYYVPPSSRENDTLSTVVTTPQIHVVTDMPTVTQNADESTPPENSIAQQPVNAPEASTDNDIAPADDAETLPETNAETSVNAAPETSNADSTAAVSAHLLDFTFSGDCWLKVTEANTKRILYMGTKKAGETLSFNTKAQYDILIGNYRTVSLTFNEKPVNLRNHLRRGTAAQLRLNATNL